MSTYLERIESLSPEIISDFRKKGKSNAIPAELQEYIRDLEKVIEIRENKKTDNITRLSRELVKCKPHLTERTARQRVSDSYNFFFIDDSISAASWDMVYADKMEDLAKLSLAKGNEQAAFKAFEKAYYYRQKAAARKDYGDFKPLIMIISNKINIQDYGFEKKSLHKIASKAEAGAYLKMIQGLPTSKEEKQKMIDDADLGDYVDYEEVDDNE
jgi:hypothetical protein